MVWAELSGQPDPLITNLGRGLAADAPLQYVVKQKIIQI